jgi:hypothetical protein
MRFLDWAGSAGAPGAGVLLLRKLAELTDTLFAVGGSAQTQAILPKAGFEIRGESVLFAKVVRPWGQLRSRPSHDWKSPARLARNVLWSLSGLAPARGWSAVRVPRFDAAAFPGKFGSLPKTFTPVRHNAGILNYLLGCPGAAARGGLLVENGATRGYFVVSRAGRQGRIAGVFVDSERPEDWRAAYAVACRAAAEHPAICEVAAAGSMPLATDAISANGFRPRRYDPVLVYDPKRLLAGLPPLNLQLLDGDEFFLSDPAYPYLT